MDREWAARARSFGAVAEQYDRHRPDYPDALYAAVLALTPGRRVLEAGAGTGRATLALARRGASVVAVEPDGAMAAVARGHVAGLDVRVETSAFERYRPETAAFDLVVAAQAWHWVDPDAGAVVAARALRPGGALAVWWNGGRENGGPVWDAVHAVYARHAPELTAHGPLGPGPERRAEAPVPGFEPWTRVTVDWEQTYDAERYRGLIGTHSNHLRLPDGRRERLVDGVRDAIDEHGGVIEYQYRTVLLWARPAG